MNSKTEYSEEEIVEFLDDIFSYVDNEENPDQETAITIDPFELLRSMQQTSSAVQKEKIKQPKAK
jgi:hypothetical protein